jgi:O-antigen/teichoic acid export membrane protein
LNYVISFVGLISTVAILGLDNILIREVVRDEDKRNVLLGTAFTLRMVAAILVCVVLVIVVQFTSEDITTRILIYIIGFGVIGQAFGMIEFYFKSKVLSKYIVISQVIALVSVSIIRIILVFYEASLPMFAFATSLDYFVIGVGLVFFYEKHSGGISKWMFDKKVAKYLLGISWPLIFSALAITAYMKFNQLMVKWMLGNEASGYYGVCVRLSEMWYFIPTAICSSVFPSLINSKKHSEELYLKRLQQLYNLIVLISVAIALPLTIFSHTFVNLLFGEAYAQSADIMSLYVWSGVFTSMGIANSNWIIIENLQKFRMYCLIIAGVMNIVLGYVLINAIGLNGAAIATLISYSVANYFSLLVIPKGRPMFISLTRSFNVFSLARSLKNLSNRR